jgi:DNA-directed RNA polymerase specialized sigma24 family protein
VPRRLHDVEAAARQEAAAAEAWANRNRKRIPKLLDGTDGFERVRLHGKLVRRVVPLWLEALNRERDYAEARKFVPLQGEPHGIDIAQAAMSVRVKRALARLTPEQRELLEKRYVQGKTLVEMRSVRESRQAVYDRVRRARVAFEQAWLDTADLPVVLSAEDF